MRPDIPVVMTSGYYP